MLTTTSSYLEAEATVDRLADAGFPVRHVRIVGRDLHSVEQVTGPMSSLRSAGAGAASGAWFGLLIGLLLSVFTPVAGWIVLLSAGLVIGALWGAFFGFVAHLVTRGRRDFASVKHLARRAVRGPRRESLRRPSC